MKLLLFVCALTLTIAPQSWAQSRVPRQRGGSARQGSNPTDKNATIVLPTFSGVLRGIDKKFILLEAEDGNTQKFNITKKTKFLDGEKPIQFADLKVGSNLAVEVQLALDRSFDCVNVRLDPKK